MNYDVVIVGAGIAGLSCAKLLHKNKRSFIILEASNLPGGRIKTETVDGFQMDHGFQVLQTGYPEASKALNLEKLKLKKFPAGVAVRYNKKFHIIADPRHHPRYLLSTLSSPIGTLKDRFLMLKLAKDVCRGSLEQLFDQEEKPAMVFLQDWGFSSEFITRFFVPFFAGACLDPKINASSHVLKYIFRVFAQGDASLPSMGMGEIPLQIAESLPRESIKYNSKVIQLDDTRVTIEDGTLFHGRTVVLATSQNVLPDLVTSVSARPSIGECCLYYSADWLPPFKEPFLVLNGEGRGPINNIAFPSLVAADYAPPGKTLIAAVVLGKENMTMVDLEQRVRNQCVDWFGREAENWDHMQTVSIEHALPVQDPPTSPPYILPEPVNKSLRIIGEYQSLPGIQWALLSGRMAAESIISET
jgi:phytoene dehydrogenase-like protein